MQCSSCKFENQAISRFCSSCGTPLLTESDIKSPSEITLSWLIELMKSFGYEISDENYDDNSFLAKHQKKNNLFILFKNEIPLIAFSSSWSIKKPCWGQKAQYLDIINKANKFSWLCTCDMNEKMDCFNITSALYVTEKISSRDIDSFLDIFSNGISVIIKNSGIIGVAS